MDEYDTLLDLIYAMPFDSRAWPKIMARLSDLTGSMGAVLQSPPQFNPTDEFSVYMSINFDPVDLAYGAEHYGKDDPFSGPMLTTLNGDLSKVAHGFGAIKSQDVLKGNAFWNDYQSRMGMGDVLGLILHEPSHHAFPVLSLVKKRDGEPYSEEAIRKFQALAGHLRFATRLLFTVQSVGPSSADVDGALNTLPTPCALLGPLGNVTLANQAMVAIAERKTFLQLSGNRLSALTKAADDRLQTAIGFATRNMRGAELVITDRNDDKALVLVTPVGGSNRDFFDVQSARAAVFVLTESPPSHDQKQLARLKSILSLSDQETLVARDLLRGLGPEDISMLQGKSLLTVRTQIRNLLRKNNLRRVVDLQAMRRLFSGFEQL